MSKIEEVARAIDPHAFFDLGDLRGHMYATEGQRQMGQDRAKRQARAAIAAMHAPTDAMKAAGVTAAIDRGLDSADGVGPEDVDEIWREMSFVAL